MLPRRSLLTKVLTAATLLCAAAALMAYQYLPRTPRLSRRAASNMHELASIQHEERIGNKTYKPSFGIFPLGCKWREVATDNSSTITYQYWNAKSRRWEDDMPLACTVKGLAAPAKWDFHKGTPRSEVEPKQSHVMYRNVWYNNGRWYALVDGPEHVPSWRFSRNQEIVTLHVKNATEFARSVKWRVVPGDTLMFDFIYFIHPTAIGHWWEMLGPLYSILKTIDFKRPCDQFILLHLRRNHFMEWVRAMAAVTLGVRMDHDLPPVLMQQETDNIFHQISKWPPCATCTEPAASAVAQQQSARLGRQHAGGCHPDAAAALQHGTLQLGQQGGGAACRGGMLMAAIAEQRVWVRDPGASGMLAHVRWLGAAGAAPRGVA
jgi:hypothetical protein